MNYQDIPWPTPTPHAIPPADMPFDVGAINLQPMIVQAADTAVQWWGRADGPFLDLFYVVLFIFLIFGGIHRIGQALQEL